MQFQINQGTDPEAIQILDSIVRMTGCSRTRAAIYAIKMYGCHHLGMEEPERPKERPPLAQYSDAPLIPTQLRIVNRGTQEEL